ncbi:MAG: MoxR family ATPase [Deltaproteobacteria bacterium]|nr:MoxR family ATPase [Deltaproteobacteria bacterium]MBI3077906.1 MoxR family ATPase [Deltaproteobacteria bacterium]
MEIPAQVKEVTDRLQEVQQEIAKVIVGHTEAVQGVLTVLLAGGHALLEGVPGLGKTLLVKTLASTLALAFSRIQFTPDLMPADIVGTNIIMQDAGGRRYFEFQRGPIFGNVILADEINRATPKTQSALLEAMQELHVTVMGKMFELPPPFFVLATQNPIEMEGTYPLPEAQLDRFLFKLKMAFSSPQELAEVLDRTTEPREVAVRTVVDAGQIEAMKRVVLEVPIASHVREYAVRVTFATHPNSEEAPDEVRRFVKYGASPRGAQALVLGGKVRALLDGRLNVSIQDIRDVALPALRHRIILNFEGEAEGLTTDDAVKAVLERLRPDTGTIY